MARLHRAWPGYALLAALAIAALGGFIYLRENWLASKTEELTLEIAKACLTVFVAAFAGTILKAITEMNRSKVKEEARQRTFKRNMLTDLKAVHDSLESARLLIVAHKSAKSYGEQIRRLGRSRVRLEGVHRAIRTDSIDFQKARHGIVGCIHLMIQYIERLEREYNRQYLPASRLQRIDEEFNKRLAEQSVKDGKKLDGSEWKADAWEFIESEFPDLQDLLCGAENYQAEFKRPLDAITAELRSQIAGQKSGLDLSEYTAGTAGKS